MNAIIIFIAKYFIVLSAALALYVFIRVPREEKLNFLLTAVVGAVIAYALAKLAGMAYYDTRPFAAENFTPLFPHANNNGFPSDHTLLSGFLGFLALRYNRVWGAVLLGLAVLIGLSRVFAGVHHVLDIVASLVIAGVAVGVAVLIFKRRTKKPFSVSSEE